MVNEYKVWITESLKSFFSSCDRDLIDRKLHEECINHRLALHFEKCRPLLFDQYYIDLEYNKNKSNEKSIQYEGIPKYIRPDIIIHRRTEDTTDNLIALECKLNYLTKNDKLKLEHLSLPEYNYKLCLGISYQPNKEYFLIYRKFQGFTKPLRISKMNIVDFQVLV